jgi:hypothetical protein
MSLGATSHELLLGQPFIGEFVGLQVRGVKIRLEVGVRDNDVPFGWGVIFGVAVHSFEPVVEDNMELGRDTACDQVTNQGHLGRVEGAPADELTAATARLPLRKFASILESGFQHISRTSPNMQLLELVSRPERLAKAFFGGEAIQRRRGDNVEKVLGVLHGHGPEIGRALFGPTKLSVKQLTASLGDDCSNATLGNTILVVRPDTRDGETLMVGFDFVHKSQLGEDSVVGTVGLDGNATRHGKTLESQFGTDRVVGTQRNLKVRFGETSGDIDEESAAAELVHVFLTAAGRKEAATLRDLELIHSNFGAREEFAVLNAADCFGAGGGMGGPSGATHLLGVSTRGTRGAVGVPQSGNARGERTEEISAGEPSDHRHGGVAQAKVPAKSRLLRGRQILVRFLSDTGIEPELKSSRRLIHITEHGEKGKTSAGIQRGGDNTPIRREVKMAAILSVDAIGARSAGGHETLGREKSNRKLVD